MLVLRAIVSAILLHVLLTGCSERPAPTPSPETKSSSTTSGVAAAVACTVPQDLQGSWEVRETGKFEYADPPQVPAGANKGDMVTITCSSVGNATLYHVNFTEAAGGAAHFKEFSALSFGYVDKGKLLDRNYMIGDEFFNYTRRVLTADYSYLIGAGKIGKAVVGGPSVPTEVVSLFVPIFDKEAETKRQFSIVLCNLDEMPCNPMVELGARQGGVIHGKD